MADEITTQSPMITTDSSNFTGDTSATGGLEGIWDTLRNESGIADLEGKVSGAKGELIESKQAGRNTQQALRDRPESINLIRGRQQQASLMQYQDELSLTEQANLSIDELNMKNQELQKRFGFKAQEYQTMQNTMLSNPEAGIKIGDSIETATKKLGDYQEQQRKDIEKQELKNLAMQLGISTKGSRSKLRKRISKANKKALEKQEQLIDQQIESGRVAIDASIAKLNATKNEAYTVTGGNWENNYFEDTIEAPTKSTPQEQTSNAVTNYFNATYPIK